MYKKTVLAIFLGLLTGCGGSDVEDEIKALWYEHNMLLESEFSVEVKAKDINHDGQTDWFTTSSYNCGSQGCTYELWSKVDNKVCMVGKWSSDIRKLEIEGNLQCNENIFLDISSYDNSPSSSQQESRSNSSPELKLEIEPTVNPLTGGSFESLVITPKSDFTIEDIELNRGKCRVYPPLARDKRGNITGYGKHFPKEAKWGEQLKFGYSCKGNELLEIKIHTNQGTLQYSVD